jgi:hypothetical protein
MKTSDIMILATAIGLILVGVIISTIAMQGEQQGFGQTQQQQQQLHEEEFSEYMSNHSMNVRLYQFLPDGSLVVIAEPMNQSSSGSNITAAIID